MNHCWQDYREHLEETGREGSDEWIATWHDGNKTCLLEDGHEGDHDFVDDNSIEIKLSA